MIKFIKENTVIFNVLIIILGFIFIFMYISRKINENTYNYTKIEELERENDSLIIEIKNHKATIDFLQISINKNDSIHEEMNKKLELVRLEVTKKYEYNKNKPVNILINDLLLELKGARK